MPDKRDPFDGDYIGNIWGWKFSLVGLALLVVLGGLIAYRHYTMDVPLGLEEELLEEPPAKDTIKLNEER
jgi:hypothetical protein